MVNIRTYANEAESIFNKELLEKGLKEYYQKIWHKRFGEGIAGGAFCANGRRMLVIFQSVGRKQIDYIDGLEKGRIKFLLN